MVMYLSSLALEATSRPSLKVCVHSWPEEMGSYKVIPGCARLCKELNTVRWKFSGTNGRGVPVDASLRS